MKKMIPVYLIMLAMLGAFGFVSFKVLRKLDYMNARLVAIESNQSQSGSDGVMEVEVVNSPSVTVTGSVDVNVDEPLKVRVANEPLEVSIH